MGAFVESGADSPLIRLPSSTRGEGPRSIHQRCLEFVEGPAAMADGVLFGGVHLSEGLVRALGLEDGIVTMTAVAARREDQLAVHPTLDHHAGTVRPGHRQGRG